MIGENFSAVILAGGKGKRMCSSLLKVLHPVAGRPMLEKVIDILGKSGIDDLHIVVPPAVKPLLEEALNLDDLIIHTQREPLGTGDALKAVPPENLKKFVLVINGDQPLIETKSVTEHMKWVIQKSAAVTLVSARLKDPGNYGRIVRENQKVKSIVEHREALNDPSILSLKEVNTGLYFFKRYVLQKYLPLIKNRNLKREYYLTDIVSICEKAGEEIKVILSSHQVAFGINTQEELARATKFLFQKKVKALLESGVIIVDPENTYVEEQVLIENATVIYPGVWIKGKTKIGCFCIIESNTTIVDSDIKEGVQIRSGSNIEGSTIERASVIGPYARLRPKSRVGEFTRVGNFVEMKNVNFGDYSKAAHLSYLGDATVGKYVNIGCGVVTCNYSTDHRKYETVIGDHAFIGSNSQLVAPIEVGAHTVIGAGSVITKDVPPGSLSLTRIPQVNKENYSKEDERHLASSQVRSVENDEPSSNSDSEKDSQ